MKTGQNTLEVDYKKMERLERQVKALTKKSRCFKDKTVVLEEKTTSLKHKNVLLKDKNVLLEDKNAILEEELRELRLQLKEYQEKLFKKKMGGKKKDDEDDSPEGGSGKKRGAPKGHPGTTRKVPDRVDEHVDVELEECPECHGNDLRPCNRHEDHYQEDIVIPQVKVTRYRHYFYYCLCCKKVVYGVGSGEMPKSFIGPVAKSLSNFMHYQMGLSYGKIQRLFRECFQMEFTRSSCPGFDGQARSRGQPIYKDLKESLVKEKYLHVDETGWRNDGQNGWLWIFGGKQTALYWIDPSRGSKVLESVLGQKYNGVLISDFLGAYNKIKSRKQRCLIHLLRLIKKWLIYYDQDKKIQRYLHRLKKLIKEVIKLSQKMGGKKRKGFATRKAELTAQLRRMLKTSLDKDKIERFRKRLWGHFKELITCLNFIDVCSHNNFAERLLRGNVIMRKITFGNRSQTGARNHEVLMSLIQTAHLRGLNSLKYLRLLLEKPALAKSVLT